MHSFVFKTHTTQRTGRWKILGSIDIIRNFNDKPFCFVLSKQFPGNFQKRLILRPYFRVFLFIISRKAINDFEIAVCVREI